MPSGVQHILTRLFPTTILEAGIIILHNYRRGNQSTKGKETCLKSYRGKVAQPGHESR